MTRRDWIVLAVIVLAAAVPRLAGLGSPPERVFDESWYARDGCYYWVGSKSACGLAMSTPSARRAVDAQLAKYGELTPEHPPLGKWLIGAPVKVLGFGPRAWRLASVLAGLLSIALLFVFVRKALLSTPVAAAAALLLAVDYPHVIHSRLAMLDIFLCLFVLAAFLFCFLDRAQIQARFAGAPAHHRWRLAAGVAAGAAAATKVSGGAAAVGILALIVGWEIAERRRSGGRFQRPGATAGSIVLLLVVVPLVVHAATYAGRLDGELLALPWADTSWVRAWVDRQSLILDLQVGKPTTLSSPLALPMTEQPLSLYLERQGNSVREILLFGNPLLWWAGFLAIVYAVIAWSRDRRSAVASVIVVGFLAAYASWLAATLTRTGVFLFYIVPVAPFLYLALAHAYVQVPRTAALRAAAAGLVAVSVAAFVFFLPILTGRQLDRGDWRPRACVARALWPVVAVPASKLDTALWLDGVPRCGQRARPDP